MLAPSVFEEASQAVLDYQGSGLSILEISHRSKAFMQVLEEAKALTRELLGLNDDYAILFLSGGATSQFFMTALNLLPQHGMAAYIDTGVWSHKAIQDAKLYGEVSVVASSQDAGYTYIPKGVSVPDTATYLHLTTNNTIYGTQYHTLPDTSVPIVADMSSDIFSRPIDAERYGLIYAGAQKNAGAAGTTLVVVRRDMLGKTGRKLPQMLDYAAHIQKDSVLNTPPVFPIYVSMLNMRWIKASGGITAMTAHNAQKADAFYAALDRSQSFVGKAHREDRSLMNATFVLKDETLTPQFLELCQAAGIESIKGHRSAGGFRASMYNAMPLESVQALIEVMEAFDAQYA